ncbi:MAG: hypothetical protein GY816_13990 [Cytophagales bacterium]|nr:hypothetical protein [Cytophagales bacterium]
MKNYIILLLLTFASISALAQDGKDKKEGLKRIDQNRSENITIIANEAVIESLQALDALADLDEIDFDFDFDFQDMDIDINVPNIDINIPEMNFEFDMDDLDIDVNLDELRNDLKEMKKSLHKLKEKEDDN